MDNVIPFDEGSNPDDQIKKTMIITIQRLREAEHDLRNAAQKKNGAQQIELHELADSADALGNKIERQLEQLMRTGSP